MNDKQVEQQIDEAVGSIKEEQSWLLTYADMMTLLFAFFVLLFSLSTIDPVKISQLQDGMGDQPELKSFNEITEDFKEIVDELNIEEQAKVSRDPRGVTLELDGDICFQSGSTTIHSTLQKVLNAAAKKVFSQSGDPRLIIVEGHTDSDPIPKSLQTIFPTNWELSTARAISVVKHLTKAGIPPNRLAATGFGQHSMLDPRQDEIAKRRNRRIELKLTQR